MVMFLVTIGVAVGPNGLLGSGTAKTMLNTADGRMMVSFPVPGTQLVAIIWGVPSGATLSIATLVAKFAEEIASCSEQPGAVLIFCSTVVTKMLAASARCDAARATMTSTIAESANR